MEKERECERAHAGRLNGGTFVGGGWLTGVVQRRVGQKKKPEYRVRPMHLSLHSFFRFTSTTAALAISLGLGSSLTARDSKADAHPPLTLNVDARPIDRNAAERVSYAPIVSKTAASVVFVYSNKQVKGQDLTPFMEDPMLRRFFGGPGGRNGRTPDQVQHGLGSGVIISGNGYILTNNHVVEGADEVKVSIGESLRRYDATVVGTDALADVAVLQIKADGLVPATFGDSDQLQVGDVVLAIGNPFGIGQSVSRGIVSALGRGPGIEAVEDFIQTDAAINPGNSGGALIDSSGRVVGINTAIVSGTGGSAGVGFAIPINLVRRVTEQIIATGHATRGFLGVQPQELTPELADRFKSERGALIAEVTPGSPADKAGLAAGDVITKINDTEIRSARYLLLAVSQFAPDTEVTVEFLRDGKTRTVTAKLTNRPETSRMREGRQNGDTKDVGVLNGVGVGDITPELRDQLQIPERLHGAVITDIDSSTPSAKQGLREGDVILELDRQPVKNAEDAVRLSEEIKGPKVTVRIWREGRSRYIVVDEAKK